MSDVVIVPDAPSALLIRDGVAAVVYMSNFAGPAAAAAQLAQSLAEDARDAALAAAAEADDSEADAETAALSALNSLIAIGGSVAVAAAAASNAAASLVAAQAVEDAVMAAIDGVVLTNATIHAANRTILAALDTALPAYAAWPGGEGMFVFVATDLSAQVTLDPLQGIYVAPSSDTDGSSGAWVRAVREPLNPLWFMTAAQVADVRAYDFTQNVTAAIRACAAFINANDGGTLHFPPGGYLVGEQEFQGTLLDGVTPAAYGASRICEITNCTRPIKISGYGAVLKAIDGYKYGAFDPTTGAVHPSTAPFTDYDYYGYLYRGMFDFQDNESIHIEGFELDGNNTNAIIGGEFGDSKWQVEGTGIHAYRNKNYTEIDVNSHHHPLDSRIIGWNGLDELDPPYPHTLINPKGRFNGRQGLSLVGGNKVMMINPDFSMTGQAMNTSLGDELRSTPGAGIDIEAEGAVIRNVVIENPNIQGNSGAGIAGNVGDSRSVRVIGGLVETVVISRPRYSFHGTKIFGRTEFALAVNDPYTSDPYTPEDGVILDDCHLSYDGTKLELGALQHSGQSLWNEARHFQVRGCYMNTGAVQLPSFGYIYGIADAPPLVINSSFKSTAVTEVLFCARYQGRVVFTHSGTVTLDVGPPGNNSRIETGDVVINGTVIPAHRAAAQSNSTAADVTDLKTDFNALLAKMRTAGLLAP